MTRLMEHEAEKVDRSCRTQTRLQCEFGRGEEPILTSGKTLFQHMVFYRKKSKLIEIDLGVGNVQS